MIKKFFLVPAMIIVVATACKNQNSSTTATSGQTTVRELVTVRDISITKANAYNDIFLDSNEVEKFIVAEKLNDTLAPAIRGFYNARNFEFAWFASTGLIEQTFSFHSLYCTENCTDPFNKSLEKELDKIRVEQDTVIDAKDPIIIKTELQVTQRFIEYTLENNREAAIAPAVLGTYIPAKKRSITALADSVLANNDNNKNYAASNEAYRLLKAQLQKYSDIVKKGGWPTIAANSKKYTVGSSGPEVALFKKRLQATGELAGTDTTAIFNAELESAVKTYQADHGDKPTGIVTAALIKDMNSSALSATQQILINMQRMRWMPTRPQGKLIIVNIPEFELYMDSGKTNLFHMDVVVGAEGHNTTMFSGRINQVVFSPYWDVPPSIVKKEILPGIERNKNYLEKKNMEITGHEGGLPVVRQRPGDKNALGQVKFLFPNSFNIYLHDSPEKALFNKSERDLSHGCIRLSDAPKMAHYLLQNSKTWTPEKIDSAMNSGVEQVVQLKPSVPVIITYYTAWVDNKGALHFADDVYGQDNKMALKMFTNPQIQVSAH
jgi:murein L,D-transpeptidase YcbB/YkuD